MIGPQWAVRESGSEPLMRVGAGALERAAEGSGARRGRARAVQAGGAQDEPARLTRRRRRPALSS